jgi:hypothetical protein
MSAARPAQSRQKARARRGAIPAGWHRWRSRLAWGLAIVGTVLFVVGNIGARAGFAVLPFDPHHVYAQFGGAGLAIIGVMWANWDRK